MAATSGPPDLASRWRSRHTPTLVEREAPDGARLVNEYRIGELLGEGASAAVFRAERVVPGRPPTAFALKVIDKDALERRRTYRSSAAGGMVRETALDHVRREIDIMSTLFHRHVALLFEVIDDPEHSEMFLVLELAERGESMQWDPSAHRFVCPSHVPPSPLGGLAPRHAAVYFLGLVRGLAYLHDRCIVHRDIKPSNVMVNEEGKARITDFGTAAELPDRDARLADTKGTHAFLAPECCAGGAFDPFAADVWAAGVTLYAWVFGALPFWAEGAQPLLTAIMEQPLAWPERAATPDDDLADLLARLLDKDPLTRISLAEAEAHPWTQRLTEGGNVMLLAQAAAQADAVGATAGAPRRAPATPPPEPDQPARASSATPPPDGVPGA